MSFTPVLVILIYDLAQVYDFEIHEDDKVFSELSRAVPDIIAPT